MLFMFKDTSFAEDVDTKKRQILLKNARKNLEQHKKDPFIDFTLQTESYYLVEPDLEKQLAARKPPFQYLRNS